MCRMVGGVRWAMGVGGVGFGGGWGGLWELVKWVVGLHLMKSGLNAVWRHIM